MIWGFIKLFIWCYIIIHFLFKKLKESLSKPEKEIKPQEDFKKIKKVKPKEDRKKIKREKLKEKFFDTIIFAFLLIVFLALIFLNEK